MASTFLYEFCSKREKIFFWNILEIENFIYELVENVKKGVHNYVP
jgi:hypothetical protein